MLKSVIATCWIWKVLSAILCKTTEIPWTNCEKSWIPARQGTPVIMPYTDAIGSPPSHIMQSERSSASLDICLMHKKMWPLLKSKTNYNYSRSFRALAWSEDLDLHPYSLPFKQSDTLFVLVTEFIDKTESKILVIISSNHIRYS